MECPICFLYYPPYLNRTRCCDQAICSECFVQIKRPDPHPPDHGDPTAPPPDDGIQPNDVDADSNLVSEPAACPFCVQPEFGITYDPPPFKRGLIYVNQTQGYTVARLASAMSSSSSLASSPGNGGLQSTLGFARRRTTSISATSPAVITTDRVRPDWAHKLSSARAHAARRSAAATALHTAAYLMGNGGQGVDPRGFGGFGRRNLLRRGSGADSPTSGPTSAQLSALALLAERHGASGTRVELASSAERGPTMLAPPPRASSRRSRIDDLEEMMMLEAIRLSLASEEERKKKEDKEAKKEAKRKEKEAKKAGKAAKKTALYSNSANASSAGFDGTSDKTPVMQGKGKAVDRSNNGRSQSPYNKMADTADTTTPSHNDLSHDIHESDSTQLPLNDSFAFAPSQSGSEPPRRSHLRQMSTASSSVSSFVESSPGSLKNGLAGSNSSFEASPSASGYSIACGDTVSDTPGSATPSGGAGTEPMFNFRSLAAMIDDEEKEQKAAQIEDVNKRDEALNDPGMSDVSRHVSPERRERSDSVALEQSTATLKANRGLEESTSQDAQETPNVMVTSPSQVTLQGKNDELLNSSSEANGIDVEPPK